MWHIEFPRKLNILLVVPIMMVLLAAPVALGGTSDIPVDTGQAEIFYLCHSGWAMKTASAFLIFDYWERTQRPERPSLSNGCLSGDFW